MNLLTLRRTKTGLYPKALETIMPFRGACGFCGCPDARHRVIEAARGAFLAGDSSETIAENWPELKPLLSYYKDA